MPLILVHFLFVPLIYANTMTRQARPVSKLCFDASNAAIKNYEINRDKVPSGCGAWPCTSPSLDRYYYEGMIKHLGGTSTIPGYTKFEAQSTVPDWFVIVGIRGHTVQTTFVSVHSAPVTRDILYRLDGVYALHPSTICDPKPQFFPFNSDHVNLFTDIARVQGRTVHTFDVVFTDIYAGFYVAGFYSEHSEAYINPNLCQLELTSYLGLFLRHHITGEERMYTISGEQTCTKLNQTANDFLRACQRQEAVNNFDYRVEWIAGMPNMSILDVTTTYASLPYSTERNLPKNMCGEQLQRYGNGCFNFDASFRPWKEIAACTTRDPRLPALTDGSWTPWSPWTKCNDGKTMKVRLCVGREGKGADCIGSTIEYDNCTAPVSAPNIEHVKLPTSVTPLTPVKSGMSTQKKVWLFLLMIILVLMLSGEDDKKAPSARARSQLAPHRPVKR